MGFLFDGIENNLGKGEMLITSIFPFSPKNFLTHYQKTKF